MMRHVSLALALAGCCLLLSGCSWVKERVFYQAGKDAYHKRDYTRAIAYYSEAILLEPHDADAYNNRGLAYHAKGDNDRAMMDFDQAIQLNPQDAQAYNNRGMVYKDKGDYEKAIADYDQAIQLDAKLVPAYNNRGLADHAMGDNDRAIVDFDQAIQINPRDAKAYVNRSLAYRAKHDYAKAIADDNQAIQIDPRDMHAYNNLAWDLATCPQAELRDGKKAVEYATKACELSGWKVPAYMDTLAAACAEAGDFDDAVKWESQFLETPKLRDQTIADAKSRLALYQAHQPYHADK